MSMGVPGVDPSKEVGKYVGPEEWNELLKDPETVGTQVFLQKTSFFLKDKLIMARWL